MNSKKYLGRIVKDKYEFKVKGTFQSLYAAQEWCNMNGFSYASLCCDEPVALMQGDYNIAKWKNLTRLERKSSDGVMTSGDFREGSVTILIFEPLRVRPDYITPE